MLTSLRQMLRSKAAGGLFVLLIVAMAAWGVTDIFAGGSGNNLVSAGDRGMTDQEFDARIERVLRTVDDGRGRALTKEQALERGIVDEVFQQQTFETLLMAYADKLGISATKGAVAEAIRTDANFQDTTGVFDPLRYQQLLDANGFRPIDYEMGLEADMTIERLQELPISGLKVPKALARLQAAYSGETRSAAWFILQQSELPEIEAPTEEEIRELYDTRQDALREPERRAISLVRLSPDDFISQSEVAEEDIIAFYEAYKADRYTGPDSRTFTEFFFPDEATARAALGRIAGGAAPEAIETATSTAVRSGRREVISNERLAEQVFSFGAAPGSIHGPQPVGTQFLVIRLEEITPGDATPLEVVRFEIEEELAREQAIGLFYDALPRFDDLIGTGSALEVIAEGLGAPVLSFAPAGRNGVGANGSRYLPLTSAPGLLEAVFNRAEGQTTERFTDQDVTWLARVDRIVPERLPEFEEVRDRLETAARQQKLSEQLQNAASQIETAIAEGTTTIEAEADKYNSTVEVLPRPITRTNTDLQLPPQLISAIFSADKEGDTFALAGMAGQTVIVQVTDIDRPESETLDLLADSSALNIQNQIGEDLFSAYLVAIQGDVELKANTAALNAYKRSLVAEQ